MKNPFQVGDRKVFETVVTESMLAEFDAGIVHHVYGTFALGRDAEWTCRLFVLEMLEEGEEGIGSFLAVEHLFPAPIGSKVKFEATLTKVEGNEVTCSFSAWANGNEIAKGTQIQKIINRARFNKLINSITIS